MTQIATVKCLAGENRAEVLVCRQSACGYDCTDCGGCGSECTASVTAVVDNSIGARPGAIVRVESESRQILGIAFVLYFVPLVLLFVGYFTASGLLKLGEGISSLFGLIGLAAGIAINVLVDYRLRKEESVQFRITEVLKSCSDM